MRGAMNMSICKRLLVLAGLVIGLWRSGVVLPDLVAAQSVTTAKTLDRDLEPVIITGTDVTEFLGVPVDQLFLYAYTEGAFRPIPVQVDEVTASGDHTATEDGLLDANDEIVFMAKDLGDQAPADSPITSSLPISTDWYGIVVTDPTNPIRRGGAYLVSSTVLTQTTDADYVDFDLAAHRINGQAYSLGFATPDAWVEYLRLNGSVVDILDRTPKMRLCYDNSASCFTEEILQPVQDDLIKDGPVRLILRGGRVLAYGAMAVWSIPVPTILLADSIRFSTDFSAVASGATFYNSVVPQGVIVDGVPDQVPETPFSSWWQLSTSNGTVIQACDASEMGGTPTNYYEDDSTWDFYDTGDHRRYGDTGVLVEDANSSFTYRFAIYFLDESQPNVGETYASYFAQPVSAMAHFRQLHLPESLYLPLVLR
jgi:hypothetical protein